MPEDKITYMIHELRGRKMDLEEELEFGKDKNKEQIREKIRRTQEEINCLIDKLILVSNQSNNNEQGIQRTSYNTP